MIYVYMIYRHSLCLCRSLPLSLLFSSLLLSSLLFSSLLFSSLHRMTIFTRQRTRRLAQKRADWKRNRDNKITIAVTGLGMDTSYVSSRPTETSQRLLRVIEHQHGHMFGLLVFTSESGVRVRQTTFVSELLTDVCLETRETTLYRQLL